VLGGIGLALAVHGLIAKPARNRPRHRVVVVGAGFGGLQAARTLAGNDRVDLCVIDQHNHQLFQPLLYQVATAALSSDDIARPIRDEIGASDHTRVRMGSVTGIDVAEHQVICDGQPIPYDTLILATGSQTSYFGHKAWQQHAHGLKALSDALALRQQILCVFERAANLPQHDPGRHRLLTFVLIGGGPTGVEMAGSIAELAGDEKRRDFGGDPNMRARVVLIEAGEALLPHFPPDLSDRALADLSKMGVEVHLGSRVTDIAAGTVRLDDDQIAAETIIWTAGVEASPVASWLGVAPAHGGRVKVRPDLTLPGEPNIFVIGDAAEALDLSGKALPGLAPVAKQQGAYVAHAIIDRLNGRAAAKPFVYQDFGTLATIGRNRAVAWFGRVHVTGFAAWVTWAVAHIFFLIGFRNRVLVGAKWMISYTSHQRGSRVII
jgi:NADH dehydrogenase